MFTGLVEKLGRLESLRRRTGMFRLTVTCDQWDEPVKPGDSVAVQGVCLTVTASARGRLNFDVLEETIARTSLGVLKPGAPLNLERAILAGGRLGGHFVTGHIDGVGVVAGIVRESGDRVMDVECEPGLTQSMVMKGSVTLDGVSLTLTAVGPDHFQVKLIPFTWKNTSLAAAGKGVRINIETDIIGKYVAKYLGAVAGKVAGKGLSISDLASAGF
ncbi:MAG: riboflavin synthase [Verrucomicrobia bacterium]|nr:riboflavin synthase [Verrucomicrobiota bacterium]